MNGLHVFVALLEHTDEIPQCLKRLSPSASFWRNYLNSFILLKILRIISTVMTVRFISNSTDYIS